MKELIEAYKEYVELLNKEIESLIGTANVHGWRSQNVEEGVRLREKLASLQQQAERQVSEEGKVVDDIIEIVQDMDWDVMQNTIDAHELLKKLAKYKEEINSPDKTGDEAIKKNRFGQTFLDVLIENHQAQIAGFYNDDKTDEERKIRQARIDEYEDMIAVYKAFQTRQI